MTCSVGLTPVSWPGWSSSIALTLTEAVETAIDLTYNLPKQSYARLT